MTDDDYLRRVEVLAHQIVERAADEAWHRLDAEPPDATPLQRAVNELARVLRHVHFDGDGCLGH